MAVRIRQSPESLVQCLELGGYKVHSVEKIAGAPGRDIDIHLQNSVVLKWDSYTKTIWAEGPSRSTCRKLEDFLRKICEGHWLEKLEAIQRRRLMIYLNKTGRIASAKVAVQSRVVVAHSRVIAAKVAAESRVASAKFAIQSRILGRKLLVKGTQHSRELSVFLAKKTVQPRNQLALFFATRAPRFARLFEPARVNDPGLRTTTPETHVP